MSDVATHTDRRLMKKARRLAVARHATIEVVYDLAVTAAFRAELGTTIRSASPLVFSLLEGQSTTLEDALALIVLEEPWPRGSSRRRRAGKPPSARHLLRSYMPKRLPAWLSVPHTYEHTFYQPNGDYLAIQIVEHSVEIEARIGSIWLETRFGELRVQLRHAMPDTLAIACVGRTLEEVVDHEAWRGRGWRIVDVESTASSPTALTLIVEAKSVPYRIDWPDLDQRAPA